MNVLSIFLFFLLNTFSFHVSAGAIKETLLSKTEINLLENPTLVEKKNNIIKVLFKNNSLLEITGKDNFYLSYHIEDKSGRLIKWDNSRTKLNVLPKQNKIFNLKIDPLNIGEYSIIPDIIKEDEFWVGHKTKHNIFVKEYFFNFKQCTKGSDITCWYIKDKENINKLNLLINNTLRSSEKNLPDIGVSGFNAGQGYSQIWIRDSYTILQASKYFYREPFLSSWFEYFIKNLDEEGLAYDWFDNNRILEKNTVEVDQESSLALSYFELLKIDKYKYSKFLDDIENILKNVIKKKSDKATGLIKNAHTIDWGDVQYGFVSQNKSIDLNDGSYMVIGIYTNALFYKAIEKLTDEYKNINNKIKFDYWNKIRKQLHTSINNHLWNESKGFYRLHNHITTLNHPFNEDNMFGMGGNAVAMSTSLVNKVKAEKIIKNALIRQNLFNFSTISGTILPPYPSDYFKHKSVNKYFYYQNGGQWDWFGARFVKQMFNHGLHEEALTSLQEIARKNIMNKGIFEWDTMTGEGRGSADYAGASGVIGSAIIEGLFGILIDNDKISIKESNFTNNFLLNLKIPSTEKHLIYEFTNGCYKIESSGFKQIIFNKKSKNSICINKNKHLRIFESNVIAPQK